MTEHIFLSKQSIRKISFGVCGLMVCSRQSGVGWLPMKILGECKLFFENAILGKHSSHLPAKTRTLGNGSCLILAITLLLVVLPDSLCHAVDGEAKPLIRVGIIGLDTSHVIHFTTALNSEDPSPEMAGCRVVAAYPKGSPDIESAVSRVPEYTKQLRAMGVEIVDSIEQLLNKVDVVLLETNDGRPHLEQAIPIMREGKRLFIDKPMASSLAEVFAIFDAADHFKTPVFSSSALRFSKNTQLVRSGSIGDVLACDVYSPCSLEPSHPDFAWYGIHGVETLVSLMGTQCKSVSRMHVKGQDVAVGLWADDRIGCYRGMRDGIPTYGGMAFGTKANESIGSYDGYEPLLIRIVDFFRGGELPVSQEETIAIFAFIEAADLSKGLGGVQVSIKDVIATAQRDAQKLRAW